LAPAAGALAGAAIMVSSTTAFGPESFWRIWEAWFLSNGVTGVTLLPFLLIAACRGSEWWRPPSVRRIVESSLLACAVVVVSVLVLSTNRHLIGFPTRLYAPLPFLLWAAIRFGPRATCASLLVVVTSAVVGVMNHRGPFATPAGDDGVLSLYMFLAFTSVPCVLLASLVKEHEGVLNELHTDVEARKHAQRAWEEAEKRMAVAATSASLGFWACSLPPKCFWLSDHAKRVLGLRGSGEPTREQLVSLLHTDDRERAIEQVKTALDQHMACEAEFRIVRDDGELRWVTVKGRPECPGDVATQMVGVVIDVTERKHAELELLDRRRELAHLGRVATVGQLSGALAHELRQPLTAILFNARAAQHLLESETPDLVELRAIVSDIAEDDTRAGEVIARLRRLLKKDGSTFAPLHLNQVVADSLDIAHHDLMARGITVTRELEWTLPPIHGDRVELQQVMVNLVMNACDAMRTSSPSERRLQVGTSCDDAGFVVAYVTDHGTGIVQRDVEQVFEPFVTSKHEGLGLGLAICRTIVTAHRGRLWATNNPDGGATFYLALPPCAAS